MHSPKRGLWWSHVGWILCPKYQATYWANIKDFAKFPELVWLNRYHLVPGVTLASTCYLLGGFRSLLKVLSWFGLVRDLRTPSAAVLARQRVADHPDIGMHPELATSGGVLALQPGEQ